MRPTTTTRTNLNVCAILGQPPRFEPGDVLTDELMGFIQDKLAKMKWPRSIDYTDEMPRDPNGKLYKRKLRDPYWEGRERSI